KSGFEKVMKTEESSLTGSIDSLPLSEVTSHSCGIGTRFLVLDSATLFVTKVVLKCSYPILNECSGSLMEGFVLFGFIEGGGDGSSLNNLSRKRISSSISNSEFSTPIGIESS
nr:hypothetical protein [Tanacetum cinerariifolium]